MRKYVFWSLFAKHSLKFDNSFSLQSHFLASGDKAIKYFSSLLMRIFHL